MNNRNINKVKVIVAFPGFEAGDVLIKNVVSGLFEFAYNENHEGDSAIDGLYAAINE